MIQYTRAMTHGTWMRHVSSYLLCLNMMMMPSLSSERAPLHYSPDGGVDEPPLEVLMNQLRVRKLQSENPDRNNPRWDRELVCRTAHARGR